MKLTPLKIIVINAALMALYGLLTAIADSVPSYQELYVAVIIAATTFIGQLMLYFKGMKPKNPGNPGNEERNPKLGSMFW